MSQHNQEEDQLIAPAISNTNAEAKKKKIKCIIITGAIVVALVILTVVLVLVLKKSDNPTPPTPPGPDDHSINNPYYFQYSNHTSHGVQQFVMHRQSLIDKLEQGDLVTDTNQFVDEVVMRSQLLNYETLRIQFLDNDKSKGIPFEVPPYYLSQDYEKDFNRGLFFRNMGFEVSQEKTFNMRLFDKHSKLDFVTTEGRPLLAMSNFMQMGFKIESDRLFGFGERTGTFQLKDGTYTIYGTDNGKTVDDGQSKAGKEQMSSHPFLMAELRNQTFMGMYFFNSNPQQLDIKSFSQVFQIDENTTETRYFSNVTLMSEGGILDVFFFTGPTFQEVVRQYHKIIGNPKMLSPSAHGMYTNSPKGFFNADFLKTWIENMNTNNIPYNGISLPYQAYDNQHLFTFIITDLAQIMKDNPSLRWILPWSPFFSNKVKDAVNSLMTKNLLVTANDGNAIEVTRLDDAIGYCIDYFNPNVTAQLEIWFERMTFPDNSKIKGFHLVKNSPYFKSNNYTSKFEDKNINPYFKNPVWPGTDEVYKNSLPPFARHAMNYETLSGMTIYESHLNMHNLFGLAMAERLTEVTKTQGMFFTSDSTFPGAGRLGIGHVFAQTDNDWNNLKYSLAQILNFNMFGMPYSGHNICGYYQPADKDAKQELCIRSAQLAFITPIAQLSNDDLDFFKYDDNTIRAIRSNLNQRLAFLSYQRAELYKISQVGGSLVKPLFAEFPELGIYNPDMLDAVMYGDALKVDFIFDPKTTTKKVIQQGTWFDVMKNELRTARDGYITYEGNYESNIVLQKQGTIIPIQNVKKFGAKSTHDLISVPMTLSIFYDGDNIAKGHVLVEDETDMEFYEIRAYKNMITFKQQNDGALKTDQSSRNIDHIVVTMPKSIEIQNYVACAVMQDHISVQKLYAEEDAANSQVFIYSYDRSNPDDKSTLPINKVLFVFFGTVYGDPTTFDCTNILQAKVINTVQDFPLTKQYTIRQNLKQIVPDLPDVDFKIELFGDNQLSVLFAPSSNKLTTEFEKKVGDVAPSFVLDDIVTVGKEPFYFDIHADEVIFTTQNTGYIFAYDFAMLTFIQPLSNPDRFFGIGERKGNFFLDDGYQYSLYTNANNLNDIKQGNGRTVQFGKSGFFPIIYSQFKDSENMLSVFLSEGSKDIFFNKQSGQPNRGPQISVIQALNQIKMKINFNKDPFRIIRDTHQNIFPANKIDIAPDWAYGQYHLVRGFSDDQDMIKIMDLLYENKWPLEGFFLDLRFTNWKSLDFNLEKIEGGNVQFKLAQLEAYNLTLFQIMKAGISVTNDAFTKLAQDDALLVRQPFYIQHPPPVLGQDYEGTVGYPNYYKQSFALDQYHEKAFNDYETRFGSKRYGVQLINNEVHDVYCSGDCYRDNQYDPMPDHFYKVGINKQLRYSLSANKQRNIDDHNGYGYRQQLSLWNNIYDQKMFFISSSNTPGSGKFGNVGRLIDYITPHDDPSAAAVALQSLSVLGMANIGERVALLEGTIDKKGVKEHMTIQTFSPLSVHQYWDVYEEDPAFAQAGDFMRIKLMMIKYTQTQAFKQTMYGDPLVRPLFVEYPSDEMAYQVIDQTYMYGPVFLVNFASKAYFPVGMWCSNMYYLNEMHCFNSTGMTTTNPLRHLYMKQGTITPLQDAYGKFSQHINAANTTFDLKRNNMNLDLHIFVNNETETLYAHGEVLVYTDDTDDADYCYITMTLIDATISFETVIGDTQNCKYSGFRIGKLIFYNEDSYPYLKFQINNQGGYYPITPGVDRSHYRVADLSHTNPRVNIYDLHTLNFS